MNLADVYPLHRIDQNGFAVVRSVVPDVLLDTLTQSIDSVRCDIDGGAVSAGMRYLFRYCPEVVNLAKSAEMIAIASADTSRECSPTDGVRIESWGSAR